MLGGSQLYLPLIHRHRPFIAELISVDFNIVAGSYPLPNILLSPLVVVSQLVDYVAFLKASEPNLTETLKLPIPSNTGAETSGLCTGLLSAFAVASAGSVAHLQQYGAASVRLAMLSGALVDAENALREPGKQSTSFSVSWTAASSADVDAALQKYAESPDSQVLCFGSERCLPPTIARKLDARLVHVEDTNLSGDSDDRIAVIGMSCQVPNAEDLESFWDILLSVESQHTEVPPERFSMNSVFRDVDPKRKWYGNWIRDHDAFDHKFFKKSPREMGSTDPQHRVTL
ncbi:hypothetical protein THAR02_10073 [Trichoderma harzianum]|uniref:Beta-ketoacyl synthase N-terminal domain-containing protein n=1 Tax=Trichoderma harzianum TaxID=5544 RepID=A0A0F9WZF8_TRIHA|nr:hypothetical protein THAR02_10073 [Trichoderma harzianum]